MNTRELAHKQKAIKSFWMDFESFAFSALYDTFDASHWKIDLEATVDFIFFKRKTLIL